MNITLHRVIIGDSRSMSELANESVHLIVTSPPYWQLKDYGTANQIGFHDSYENYINQLNLVWKECERVLHKGCRLCINIGDQFARAAYYGRYKVIPIRTEIIKFCEILGLDYMGAIIWQKVTTTHTSGGGVVMGSYPFPRNGILKLDYEFILIFKKAGKAPQPTSEHKQQSSLTNEEWNSYFQGHWNFPGAKQDGHLAMFPEELPSRLIKMFSFVGETILDPFLGSGTTALAAKNLGRNSVGYEINNDFAPLIRDKIGSKSDNLLTRSEVFFENQSPLAPRCFDTIDLPYYFSDPHGADKKVNPQNRHFGSKIDSSEMESTVELYRVSKVFSPECLELSNGEQIRLIGIRTDENNLKGAIDFLQKKFKGKKVFYRLDKVKYDSDNRLMVYLYLENKTFINLHLIKNKFTFLDDSYNFKYKEKFLSKIENHETD